MQNDIYKVVFKYLTSNVVLQVINLLSIIMVMSSLSLDEYGKYSYIIEMMLLVSLLPELGTRTYYVKKIASSKNKLISVKGLYKVHSLLCIFSFFLIVFISFFLRIDYITSLIVGVGFLITTLYIPSQAYALAKENVKVVTLREQVQGFSKFIYILFGFVFYSKVEYFIFYPYFQALLITVFWLACYNNYELPKITWVFNCDFNFKNKDFLNLLPFSFLIIVNIFYNKIDIYMLEHIGDINSVALYVASTKFIYPFMFISGVFMNAVFPRMVNVKTRESALNFAIKYLPIIGFFIAIILLSISEFVFFNFSDGKYYGALDCYRVLVIYLPIVFTYGVLTNYFVSIGKIKFLILLNTVGLGANVFLNIILIPYWSEVGAALSTIICEFFILVIVVFYFKKQHRRKRSCI